MGLWTKMHLLTVPPAFIIFIIIALVVGRLLKDKPEKIRLIPLQIITVILLVLELMKQINAAKGGYDLYALPFHYCSLFLYLLPLHSFYHGKYRHLTDTAAFGCLCSLFLFMLVMPAIVYGDGAISDFTGSFSSFHTVVFHNLVCLYFLLTLSLGLYSLDTKRDMKVLAIFLGIYVAIAAVLSNTIKVNFHNLYECNLGIVEQIREAMLAKIGWWAQLIYDVALFILTILFAYAAYFLTVLAIRLVKRIKK